MAEPSSAAAATFAGTLFLRLRSWPSASHWANVLMFCTMAHNLLCTFVPALTPRHTGPSFCANWRATSLIAISTVLDC